MSLVVSEKAPCGNALSCAWSTDDRVALLMRSGWYGRSRGFVLRIGDPIAVVASFQVQDRSRGDTARIDFDRDDPRVVVVSDGAAASSFDARTGARISQRRLVGASGNPFDEELATPMGCLSGGRVLVAWKGKRSGAWECELRAVSLETGETTVEVPAFVGANAGQVAVALPDGDYLIVDRDLRSVARGGAVRWKKVAAAGGNVPLFACLDSSGQCVIVAERLGGLHGLDVQDGRRLWDCTAKLPRAAGTSPDGLVWILEQNGAMRWLDTKSGSERRSITFGALTLGLAVSPDGTRGMLLVDRTDLKSEARLVDLTTGESSWRTEPGFSPHDAALSDGALWIAGEPGVVRIDLSTSAMSTVHRSAATAIASAPTSGDVLFASIDGVFFTDARGTGKPRALAKVRGEVVLEMSSDGTRAFVVDDDAVRVVDTRTAKPVVSLRMHDVESITVDPPDDVFFDAAGQPHIVVDGNKVYRLAGKRIEPAAGAPRAIERRTLRAEVGADEAVTFERARRTLRVHLAADGKSALVEDGESFDCLGQEAKAMSCRLIEIEGRLASPRDLQRVRRRGLLAGDGENHGGAPTSGAGKRTTRRRP